MEKHKITILIVDDEPALVQVLKDKFKRESYRVIAAADGKEGFRKAKLYKPKIILTDILMPVLNGMQMIEFLQSDGKTKNIPIVILTNSNEHQGKIFIAVEFFLKNEWNLETLVARTHTIIKNFQKQ